MSKPRILSTTVLAKSRLFRIEAQNLEFSNGKNATFECIRNYSHGVVMVAAVNGQQELILVREYATAIGRYELGFVKGKIDPGENPEQTAGRELKEEISLGAQQIRALRSVTMSPGYNDLVTHLFVASLLYPASGEGDEMEPLEQIHWPLANIAQLFNHPEVNDARVLFLLGWLEKAWLDGTLTSYINN